VYDTTGSSTVPEILFCRHADSGCRRSPNLSIPGTSTTSTGTTNLNKTDHLSRISDKRLDVPMQLQCNNGYSKLHGSAPEGDATHSIHCFDAGRENSSFILLSNICKHPSQMLHMAIGTLSPIVNRSYDLWISNAAIVRQRCRSMLMMYQPIDRGRHLERPQHC
jgi:hypothetical protein